MKNNRLRLYKRSKLLLAKVVDAETKSIKADRVKILTAQFDPSNDLDGGQVVIVAV